MEGIDSIISAIGGAGAGAFSWFLAERKFKKSEAMSELLEVQKQYKELSEYTNVQFDRIKAQLEDSRKAEEECRKNHREALEIVTKQEERLLVLAEVIAQRFESDGLPQPIKRPHRKDLL
jgi:phage-related tail protein